MNWDRVEGNWKQFKGNVKEQWGKLTNDQIDVIAGKRDQLAGKIQEAYGVSKDEAEKQIKQFEDRYRDWNPDVIPPTSGDPHRSQQTTRY
ncbi:MAG: CsbD family protein [Aromatoleum sp.]|nr:CsbD family protein [Aromatoleum sp.]